MLRIVEQLALTQGIIDAGEQITISEGGRTVNFLNRKR